ncbi:MAG: helix-turn-helix domain-containing protein [Bacilli bacterium]|nr:helix-turn-helix domain-containing protein [Bacilli bacterium]
MNIEIANRLVQMRKKMGLSQEQLADKLGLSRQAVSKWERAEASPDTDNLICLAKLYGVSLDELLSTDDSEETIVEEQVKPHQQEGRREEIDDDTISIGGSGIHLRSKHGERVDIGASGIYVIDKEGRKHRRKKKEQTKREEAIMGCVVGGTVFLSIVAYILLSTLIPWLPGIGFSMWGYSWIVFLLIPFVACVMEGIFRKRLGPYTGAVAMLSVAAFMSLGVFLEAWHPGWVVFLAIPLFGTFAGSIDAIRHPEDPDGEKSKYVFEEEEEYDD